MCPHSSPAPRRIRNRFSSLAREFGCQDIASLADEMVSRGWREKTAAALWKQVILKGGAADIDALVERGYALDIDIRPALGITPLHFAASLGRHALVSHLLESHGVQPDLAPASLFPSIRGPSHATALFHAVEAKHARVAALLLRHGASPEGPEFANPMLKAIDVRSKNLLRQLLLAGGSPSPPVLYHACSMGWGEGVELLDAAGADWTVPPDGPFGRLPLEVLRDASPSLSAEWLALLDARQLDAGMEYPSARRPTRSCRL